MTETAQRPPTPRGTGAINILAACDAAFVQHLGVMLVSLLESNRDETVHVYLITTEDEAALAGLRDIGRRYGCTIERLAVDGRAVADLPVAGPISAATYLRLLMGDLLPSSVDRILYLDSDIVVARPIGELWRTDLGDDIAAAVMDDGFEGHRKLGLPPGAAYFNAGVLLVDLAKWREAEIGRRAIDVVRKEPHRITWWDQCALNAVLHGRWLPLDRKWNLQTHALGRHVGSTVIVDQQGRDRARAAAIVHYTTSLKPWLYTMEHPLKELYWRHLKASPWKDYRPPDRYPHSILCKMLERYCPPLLSPYLWLRRFA